APAGCAATPGRALARRDAGARRRPAGRRRHVACGRGSAPGLPRPTARRAGGAGPGRAAGPDALAGPRDGAPHGACLHGVLHSDQRRGTGPSGAPGPPGRPGGGAARLGALVATTLARSRTCGCGGGARAAHARRPTGAHRPSHGIGPPHHPRSPGAAGGRSPGAGRGARAPAPRDRGTTRGRGGAAVAHRGSAARPPVGRGRGGERAVVSGRPPARRRVAHARAPGPGVRRRIRRRARARVADPAHAGELGGRRPGRQPVRHGGHHARRRAQRAAGGAGPLRPGAGRAGGAPLARRTLVEPLLAQVRSHGFHGYRLDVREDAGAHTRALRDLSATVGLGELDGAAIRRELAGRRPLHAPHVTLAGPTDETLRVFHVMRVIQDEVGGAAAATYIVSRTRSADDLLRVLLLAREAGLVDLAREPPLSRIDIVPLFETLEDLEHALLVVR